MLIPLKKQHFLIASFLFLLISFSCSTVKLISNYDEVTDNTVNQLQRDISNYFVVLERSIDENMSDYKNFTPFFDKAKVDLNTLEIRTAAIEKNKIVQDQITELQKMVTNLEALHKLGFSSKEMITPLKQPFNSAFTSIIKLQMALKREKK